MPEQSSKIKYVLLAILIICMLGVGFLIWQKNQNQKINQTVSDIINTPEAQMVTGTQSSQVPIQIQSPVASSDTLKTYSDGKLSFSYPANWLIKSGSADGAMAYTDTYQYLVPSDSNLTSNEIQFSENEPYAGAHDPATIYTIVQKGSYYFSVFKDAPENVIAAFKQIILSVVIKN